MGVLTTNQETVSDFIRGKRMPLCKVPAFVRAVEAVAAQGAGDVSGDGRGVTQMYLTNQMYIHYSYLRVIEVGANLGDCVLWASAYARTQGLPVSALAYEPHEPSARRIGWTARVNSLDVTPRSVGIVAEPTNGTVRFFVPDHRTAESGFQSRERAGTIEVKASTLGSIG